MRRGPLALMTILVAISPRCSTFRVSVSAVRVHARWKAGRVGMPAPRLVGQEHAPDQVPAGRHEASGVDVLVPGVTEGKPLTRCERDESEGAEHRLAPKQAPDEPVARVRDTEVGGRSPPQELQGHRHLAGIGDRKHERHRLARTGASRCLQCQTELTVLRGRLSAWSARPAPGDVPERAEHEHGPARVAAPENARRASRCCR